MSENFKKASIEIEGMTCNSCERAIENCLKDKEGISSVKASYVKSELLLEYDEDKISLFKIENLIKEEGYGFVKEERVHFDKKKYKHYKIS